MKDLRSLTYEQLCEEVKAMGQPSFRAKQIYSWLHEKRVRDYSEMTNLPAALREKLASEYFPGPLTVIARCSNGTTQGFRMPDTPFLLKLLKKTDGVLVQTSANASGEPDARDCDEALAQLNGEVDMAVDGGAIDGNICGSTVVDVSGERIKILRQGPVDLQKWL